MTARKNNRQTKTTRRVNESRQIHMVQMAVAYWDGDCGKTYSLLGLSSSGEIFRYAPGQDAWVALGMEEGVKNPPNRSRRTASGEYR